MNISKKEIESHRELWANVAKKNGWYKEPFYIQMWIDKKGNIMDSVSHIKLRSDKFISHQTDRELRWDSYSIGE